MVAQERNVVSFFHKNATQVIRIDLTRHKTVAYGLYRNDRCRTNNVVGADVCLSALSASRYLRTRSWNDIEAISPSSARSMAKRMNSGLIGLPPTMSGAI